MNKTIRDFYNHFEKMDLDGIVTFFTSHATVESPTLGKMEARPFYRELFSKTKHLKTHIKDIFINPDNPHRAAVLGSLSWETKQGDTTHLESVVIFEFNPQGKIEMARIIYDAHKAREAFRKAV
jgi:hypothetical protein